LVTICENARNGAQTLPKPLENAIKMKGWRQGQNEWKSAKKCQFVRKSCKKTKNLWKFV